MITNKLKINDSKTECIVFRSPVLKCNSSGLSVNVGESKITQLSKVVVVVCPLQPSSSVSSGCPGPESSILVSSRWACPISSQVTDH